MEPFRLSDKAKVWIVIGIALFEIAFVQFNKERPKTFDRAEGQVIVSEQELEVEVNPVAGGTVTPEPVEITGPIEVTKSTETIEIEPEIRQPLNNADQTLEVHFLDVGQADSVYIGYGDFDMVIDGGNNEDGPYVVDYLKTHDVDDIELLVASHAHEDHIGGLDDVIEAFDVQTVIDSGEEKDTKTYRDYMKAAKNSGASVLEDDTRTYTIDSEMKVEIIEAVDDEKNTNNNSVVVKVTYDEVSFLFTGDLEEDIEEKILTKGIQANVFKAGHHGSSTSNSDMFLRRIKPEIIVISAGANNKYGHPHAEALARMKKHTDQIFGTWENGTILVTTDGKNIQVDAKEIVSMEDAHASGQASESSQYKNSNKTSSKNWWEKLFTSSKKEIQNEVKKEVKKELEDAVVEVVEKQLKETITIEIQN